MFIVHTEDDLRALVESTRACEYRVILTNGCFDVLHPGHIAYLRTASGDDPFRWKDILAKRALIVLVNSDESVRKLKGDGRPIHSQADRAAMVASIRCVSAVHIFHDLRVTRFIEMIKPDVWVKGGDYTIESLDPVEVEAARKVGAEIKIIPVQIKTSTTEILKHA